MQDPAPAGDRVWRLPAWPLAVVVGAAFLAAHPDSGDLATQTYRAHVFARHGFVLWDNAWYAGHHVPGYSVLFPPLGAVVGVRLLGVLCAVLSAWLFERAARVVFDGLAARLASAWFAVATGETLFSGRLTFGLGVAMGLACVTAALEGRDRWAALAALCAALSSPVAGLFVLLGAVAWAVSGPRRGAALRVAGCAAATVLALTLAFPEGGSDPFAPSSFWPFLVGLVCVVALIPADRRMLRVAGVMYVGAVAVSYLASSPMGGNVTRLGALFAGPLLTGLLGVSRRRVVVASLVPLLYVQWVAPVHDWAEASDDPSVHRAYFSGVLGFLEHQPGIAQGRRRVEVPFTMNHWETRWMSPKVLLARGWERQLDVKDNPLFYRRHLDAGSYRRWLSDNAVAFVAVPDAHVDPAGVAEKRLVLSAPGFLRLVHVEAHWRVFAVAHPASMSSGSATVVRTTTEGFALRASRPTTTTVRIRWSPYWAMSAGVGCVSRTPGGWTRVRLGRAGVARVAMRFSLTRVMARGPRCRRA